MSYQIYDSVGYVCDLCSNGGMDTLLEYLGKQKANAAKALAEEGYVELTPDAKAGIKAFPLPSSKEVASIVSILRERVDDCKDVLIISDGLQEDEKEHTAKYQLDLLALEGIGALLRSRVASYAGSVWSAVFVGAQYVGKQEIQRDVAEGRKPKRVRWVLDPAAKHCEESEHGYGCPDLAGEYDSWDALPTVPAGRVTCLGNCLCKIEVETPQGWQSV